MVESPTNFLLNCIITGYSFVFYACIYRNGVALDYLGGWRLYRKTVCGCYHVDPISFVNASN